MGTRPDWAQEELLATCKHHGLNPENKWHYQSGKFMIWCPDSRCLRLFDYYHQCHARWNELNK
jgi:hypothetical protein